MSTRGPLITKLKIEGFKSIVSTRFEPARLNVLIGANGSGKSNVLEAIAVLGCAVSGKVDEESLSYRGVRPGYPCAAFRDQPGDSRPVRLTVSLRAGDVAYDTTLLPSNGGSGRWGFVKEELKLFGDVIAERAEAAGTLTHVDGHKIDLTDESSGGIVPLARRVRTEGTLSLLGSVETYAIYAPAAPFLRGDRHGLRGGIGLAGDNLGEALASPAFRTGDRVDLLVECMRDLVDWITEVRLDPATRVLEFKDRRMHASRQWLAASAVAEGPLYALLLLTLVLHPTDGPPIFAVDNVDNALNPRLARALIGRVQELLREHVGKQLFLTVHNPLVLDALDLHDEELTRLFVVDRTLGGQTVVTRVAPGEALAKAQAAGATLSQLWVSGALGGVPDL